LGERNNSSAKNQTGAYFAEAARLKVRNIDSRWIAVDIQGGKGRKDRVVMRRPVPLGTLREHWRDLNPRV
jgi:integrase